MKETLRVLLVEDSATDAKLILHELQRAGATIEHHRVENAADMRAALATRPFDAIVSDWSLPKFSGLEALAITKSMGLDIPFLIVSGTIGEESAVQAMRAGAHDYVLKGNLARLAPAMDRELGDAAARKARRQAEEALRAQEAALRRTEEQLRHSQKMEAIGALAGGVAHDFNNLLSVILSLSEMVMEDLSESDPIRADVNEIKEAGMRAAALTRQLLAFSRQQVIDPEVLDLNQIIQDMDRMVRRILPANIELTTIPFAALDKCRADAGQLEQVVMNLVVNARDAMPHGGKLTIETANVELDDAYARMHVGVEVGRYVLLAVTDTGTGMDEATQARIFEPFFTTKEKGKGTGLGLSTVFGIVEQSGGHVWVYSEPDKGSTFKVYLPVTEEAPGLVVPRSPPSAALRGTETVLLVEDEDQIRHVARGILERHGYRVIECRSAGEALLVCERSTDPIDLLLTDVVMPQMTGPQLAERLASLRPGMRVLFVSGYTEGALRELSDRSAFLQKPLTVAAVTRKVREVLDAAPHQRAS
jgi:signal transduction histidine kinase